MKRNTGNGRSLSLWPSDTYGLFGFVLYLAVSVLFFGRSLIVNPAGSIISAGTDHDPSLQMWCLVWWPYALAHRLNPFLTKALWAPAGTNLAWVASIPALAILAAPLTTSLGPVVTFNILCVLAPALAGWASLILCRRLTQQYWPSLLGGYLFAFSPYMLGHMLGQLLLVFVFPIPLIVWLVMLLIDGCVSRPAFVAGMAVLIALQFGFSAELFATMTVFGAATLALAFAAGTSHWRIQIRSIVAPIALSYAAATVLLAPYLYYLFALGFPHGSIASPKAFSSDLLNLILPTATNMVGANSAFTSWAANFPYRPEASAYIAPPLLVIAAIWCRARWNTNFGKFIAVLLMSLVIGSLGPRLHVAGHMMFGLPWHLATGIPLIRSALPDRFSMYIALVLAVITALWAASSETSVRARSVGIAAIIVFTMPNLSSAFWNVKVDIPAFFANGTYRKYLARDETVVVIPYGPRGNSMLWQAVTGMYFRMAGGHTGPTVKQSFERWPAVNAFYFKTALPDATFQLGAFLATHDVSAILVSAREPGWWRPALAALDVNPILTDGMYVYRIDEERLAAYRGVSAIDAERRFDRIRFDTLLEGADLYLSEHHDPRLLTPKIAEQLGLLPHGWTTGPKVYDRNGLWLGPAGKGAIAVGIVASYDALKPIIKEYGPDARAVYFPYPHRLQGPPHGDLVLRKLVMIFKPRDLARADLSARASDSNAFP